MVVPFGSSRAIVAIKISVIKVLFIFLLEEVELIGKIFMMHFSGYNWAGCFNSKNFIIENQFSQYLGFDTFKKINLFIFIGESFF
ncbi:hypothetical protein D3C72_2250220 [compost metagenome]